MKNELIIKIISVVLFVGLSIGVIAYANADKPTYTITEDSGVEFETARVLSVLEDNTAVDEETENVKKVFGCLNRHIILCIYADVRLHL